MLFRSGNVGKIYEQFGFEPVLPSIVQPSIFITQGLIVLALSLLIGIYPLLAIRKLNPVTGMKK